jgi:Transposase family tnp2
MANDLQYQHDYESWPGIKADIFDSQHYQHLCKTTVMIGGRPLGHKFFSQPTDIALGISTDGFSPFKCRKHTCWPIIAFNYNLPPEICFMLEKIIPIGLILGPVAPKDMASYLVPLIDELLKLMEGVPAFDIRFLWRFLLRAYLILFFSDMPALAKLLCLKGHNGISPCRACRIIGIRDPEATKKTTHYVPLYCTEGPSYDPLDLPFRTHNKFLCHATQVAMSHTDAEESRRSKQFGGNGISILLLLSSLRIPYSCPHDFMYLMENIIPTLTSLWTRTYKGLDSGEEDYGISKTV